MITLTVISLLAAHFIGDWLFQSREIAMAKSTKATVLWIHVAIVTAFLAIPVVILCPTKWPFLIINGLLHAFIDWNIWTGYKLAVPATHEYWKDKRFYDTIAADQFLHLFLLFLFFL